MLPDDLSEQITKNKTMMFHYKSWERFGMLIRPSPFVQGIEAPTRKRHERISIRAINDPNYFKFAIVRHPWKRVISAFRNKFMSHCRADRHCFATHYQLRGLLSTPQAKNNEPVTFHEFAEVLASHHTKGDLLNAHFRPTATLCEVDNIQYNYIGELDNALEMDYLSLKIGGKVPFSQKDTVVTRFSKVVVFACTAHTVRLLEQVYQDDLNAYGYDMLGAYRNCTQYGTTSLANG